MNPAPSPYDDGPMEWYEWRTAPGPYPNTTLSDTLSYPEFLTQQTTQPKR